MGGAIGQFLQHPEYRRIRLIERQTHTMREYPRHGCGQFQGLFTLIPQAHLETDAYGIPVRQWQAAGAAGSTRTGHEDPAGAVITDLAGGLPQGCATQPGIMVQRPAFILALFGHVKGLPR